MAETDGRLRVVVCGSVFGQVYLEAFRRPQYPLELVGILARGSVRSEACARHYGVPLFTSIDQLPEHVQAACVVVRSRILGGKGTDIAQALMKRGIHVIQEHPLHASEFAESLRVSRAQGVIYRLNSFYVNVASVRRFIGAARELCRDQRPLLVEAACGCQLSYSLLDIIAASLGAVRPWQLRAGQDDPGPGFVALSGTLAGVPVNLRIHNELDPSDPDGFSHFLHKITMLFPQGSLSLVDTHGPVVWIPRPSFPHEVRKEDGKPHFALAAKDAPRLAVIGAAQAPSYDEIFHDHWPAGVARAVMELRRAILDGKDSPQAVQYQLMVAELWQDLLAQTGPPALIRGKAVSGLSAEKLDALRQAAADMEAL